MGKFLDPHDVVGVPDGVSIADLEIAYNKRRHQLLSKHPIDFEAINNLKRAYEFLQSEYDPNALDEEDDNDENESDSEVDENDVTAIQEEVIEEAESILQQFSVCSSYKRISKTRILLLLICFFVLFLYSSLLAAFILIMAAIIYRNDRKNRNETGISYSLYHSSIAEMVEHGRKLIDLRERWYAKEAERRDERNNQLNEYLDSKRLEEANIFGLKERKNQLPVSTALDVLNSNPSDLITYGVNEKSIIKVKDWAESIKAEFYVEVDSTELEQKIREDKFALSVDILQENKLYKAALGRRNELERALTKDAFVRFIFNAVMVDSSTAILPQKVKCDSPKLSLFSKITKFIATLFLVIVCVIWLIGRSADNKQSESPEVVSQESLPTQTTIPQENDAANQNTLVEPIPQAITLDGVTLSPVDCSAAQKTTIDVLICADEPLKKQDADTYNIITKIYGTLDDSQRGELISNQLDWLSKRTQNCNISLFRPIEELESSQIVECLRSAYSARIGDLVGLRDNLQQNLQQQRFWESLK